MTCPSIPVQGPRVQNTEITYVFKSIGVYAPALLLTGAVHHLDIFH